MKHLFWDLEEKFVGKVELKKQLVMEVAAGGGKF